MTLKLLPLVWALVAGVAMAVQGSLNSSLGKVIGLLEATFVVHAVGFAAAGLLLLVPALAQGELGHLPQAPWYTLLGGLIGVVIIYGVVAAIPRVGAALATTVIISGQVATAMLVDQFGLFGLERIPFAWPRLVGLAFLALGTYLMLNHGS